MLSGDTQVRARAHQIEKLLRTVCGDEEFPWFISDDATLLDVCTLSPEDLLMLLERHYGQKLQAPDLRLPIWRLIDSIEHQET